MRPGSWLPLSLSLSIVIATGCGGLNPATDAAIDSPSGDAAIATAIIFSTTKCSIDGVECPISLAEKSTATSAVTYEIKGVVRSRRIVVEDDVTIRPAAFDAAIANSGQLILEAKGGTIDIAAKATLDASGRGYGGGGGGGGSVYGDTSVCPATVLSPGGMPGGNSGGEAGEAIVMGTAFGATCPRVGGKGGGNGGEAGGSAMLGIPAAGGKGGGDFGGAGGVVVVPNSNCTNFGGTRQTDGLPGRAGGYLAVAANGDVQPDLNDDVFLGSGGGGGSGGMSSAGFCCGGGLGGIGGSVSTGIPAAGCNSGGGGSGGAAGGGAIIFRAATIALKGQLKAHGAGDISIGGGVGAGGGIALVATTSLQVEATAQISSLGAGTSLVNGGTVKLRGPSVSISDPLSQVKAGKLSLVLR
jgi:hypothetical protein